MNYKEFERALLKDGSIEIINYLDKEDNFIFQRKGKKIIVILRNNIDGIYDRWKMCYFDYHQRLRSNEKYIRTKQERQNLFLFGKKSYVVGK